MISLAMDSKRSAPKSIVQSVLDFEILGLIGAGAILLMAAGNLVNFDLAGKNADKVNLDLQLLCKLAVVGVASIYGAYGFLVDRNVRAQLISIPGIFLTGLAGIYVLTAMTSVDRLVSIVSSGCIVGVLLAMTTFSVWQGKEKSLQILFIATSLFVFASWLVYFLVPSVGIFHEAIAHGKYVARMSGIAHPNTLGQFSGMTVVLGFILLRRQKEGQLIILAIILVAAAALWMSFSRTSIAATFVAVAIVYRDIVMRKEILTLGVLGGLAITAAVGIGVVFGNFEQKIEKRITALFAKSSETEGEELSTATGRNLIWSESISLIMERPATGWGAATSKKLLEDYTYYTHNLLLNVLLSTGVFGGLLVVLLFTYMFAVMLTNPNPVADAIVVFIGLNGVMENVIFSNVPSAPTLILILAVLWRLLPESTPNQHAEATDRSEEVSHA